MTTTSNNTQQTVTTPITPPQNTELISTQTLASVSDADQGLMSKITKYGKIGIITHLTISWVVLGLAYLVISRTNQTEKIIKFFKLQNKVSPKAGSFAVAFVVYKASIPVRAALSLMTIPIVIKALDINVEQQKLKQGKQGQLQAQKNKNNLLAEAGIVKQSTKIENK